MPLSHLFLALLVVTIWGSNFIFVEFCLREMHPLLLCAVRFLLASLPAIFFIKPPNIPFRLVVFYGLLTFGLQFTFLFMGMHAGITPGLSSLLLQVQVFFSIGFAAIFFREIPTRTQIVGALVSFAGIVLVAVHLSNQTNFLGFLLIIAAAASWGSGNLLAKYMGNVNMIAVVVWGSFIAGIPLTLASYLVLGSDTIITSLQHLSWLAIGSLAYIVYLSTWVGYGVWSWLISRYPIATVIPFTLLVPIVGMLSSALVIGEPIQSWKLIAGVLVIIGLCINLFGKKFLSKRLVSVSQ